MTTNPNPLAPQRIVIVGNTGSGKTTLARRAAAIISGCHIELDALYHEPGWVAAEPEVFRARVRAAIAQHPSWVTDGGYRSYVWDITWAAADEIVWLDLPVWRTYARLVRRQLTRRMRNEVLWNGNRESLRAMLFSRDSLLWFAIEHRNKYRKTYPEAFKAPQLAHVRLSRLRTQREVDAWLLRLAADATKIETAI